MFRVPDYGSDWDEPQARISHLAYLVAPIYLQFWNIIHLQSNFVRFIEQTGLIKRICIVKTIPLWRLLISTKKDKLLVTICCIHIIL